ncbi:MAG: hypothetical protein EOM07_12970, partial [Clostridia bacterium]|nr:hypothetical protein [Clostridia bacterium]
SMVSMIVQKVVNMAEKLEIPVKGVIQNMSYIQCGKCGERMNVFSNNSAESQAEKMGLPLIAELPINPEFAEHMEAGQAERFAATNPEYDVILEAFKDDEKDIYARNKAVKRKVIPFL